MEVIAVSRNVPIAPRKIRLVADSVRKLKPQEALSTLSFIKKRASYVLRKTLENAIANAKSKNLKEENLRIKSIDVLEGRGGKNIRRYRFSTRGRVHPYKKRTTNIRITLEGAEEAPKALPKGGEK